MAVCLSQDLVERYVNGNCSDEERRTVEIHSVACEKCREQIEGAQSSYASRAVADESKTVAIPADTVVQPPQETVVDRPEPPTSPASRIPPAPAAEEAVKRDFESMFEGYKIIDQVGAGGGGTVWRALQLSTQRQVALKVLAPGTFGSEKARLRFQREVELTARLEHPNIARIYDSGVNRGVYYYAMELFQGQHLDKYIKYCEFSERQILELMYTVSQAVQYAHQRGVIHRDLKPSNIIVTADGQPHVLDFGLAKTVLEGDKGMTVSIDGQVTGTPAYMSPEQAAGHIDAIDTRTDVYSLGAILYHVLTGRWPCDLSGSYYDVLKNIQEEEPVRPSKIIPHFDADIEAILLKVLAKDPNERYQSVSELAHDIRCWLEGLPIIARSVDTVYLLKKFISRHRTASIIAGLLLIIISSMSFVGLYSYAEARGAVKKLQSQKEVFKRKASENLVFANQALFILFLEFWQDDRLARAQGAVLYLPQRSRERAAAQFLLDPRPLDEKRRAFQEELFVDRSSFGEFVIGEHHLKDDNKAAAIEAYNRCLESAEGTSEFDDWFKNRATRKLSELRNGDIPPQSRSNIGGG